MATTKKTKKTVTKSSSFWDMPSFSKEFLMVVAAVILLIAGLMMYAKMSSDSFTTASDATETYGNNACGLPCNPGSKEKRIRTTVEIVNGQRVQHYLIMRCEKKAGTSQYAWRCSAI